MEAALVGILVMVVPPLFGASMLYCASKVRNRRPVAGPFPGRNRILASGWVLLMLGTVATAGLLLIPIREFLGGGMDFAAVLAALVACTITSLITVAGRTEIAVARLLILHPPPRSLDRKLSLLQLLGWVLIAFPMVFLAPMVLMFGLLPVLAAVAAASFLAINRKAKQGTLLWVLAIAVDKRMSLPDEIDAHAGTLRGKRRWRTMALADRLRAGISLADALDELPGLVPPFAMMAARIGEKTGTLATALRDAAAGHARTMQQSAGGTPVVWFFFYYWVIISFAQNIVFFQMYYIVPKFKKIFLDFGTDLPDITHLLIDISDSVVDYFYFLLPLFSLPTVVLIVFGAGYCYGWENLKMPWLTRWFPRVDSPWILRNLARIIAADHPLPEGIRQIAVHHHRGDVRGRLERVGAAATAGGDCWASLGTEGLLKPNEIAVLEAAARVGNLPFVLREIAAGIERRQRYRLLLCLEAFKPVVVLAVGLIVAFICIAFFMPLVDLIKQQGTPF